MPPSSAITTQNRLFYSSSRSLVIHLLLKAGFSNRSVDAASAQHEENEMEAILNRRHGEMISVYLNYSNVFGISGSSDQRFSCFLHSGAL